MGLSHLAQQDSASSGGAAGIFVAFLLLLGGAFVMGLPRVSMVMFTLGGVLDLLAAGDFKDLKIWACVSLVLAVLSYFASRELRKQKAAVETRKEA